MIVFRPLAGAGRQVAGPGEAEHSRLVVSAAARGRGTGRALAELCIELAQEEGASAHWPIRPPLNRSVTIAPAQRVGCPP